MLAFCVWTLLGILLLLLPDLSGQLPGASALAGFLLLLRLLGLRRSCLAILPLLLGLQQVQQRRADRFDPQAGLSELLVTGSICDFARNEGRLSRFILRPNSAARALGVPSSLAVVWFDSPVRPQPGEIWQLRLRLREVRGLHGGGGMDRERRDLARRIGARASVRRSALNRRLAGFTTACPIAGLRARQARAAATSLGERRATAFIQALVVAARSGLANDDWELLRATGTTHLMAISGLHIGLVAGFSAALGKALAAMLVWLPRAPPPRSLAGVFALAAAVTYSGLAGFATPTVRALVMLGAAVLLLSLRRGVPAWQLLAIALLAVLLLDPLGPLTAGFWLSFSAVAILLLPGLALRRVTTSGYWRLAWQAQLCVSLGLAPLSLLLFGLLSLSAPLANLLIIPWFAFLVVPLALIASSALPWPPAVWLLQRAADLLEISLRALDQLAALPGLVWQPGRPALLSILLAGLGAVLLIWPRPRLPGVVSLLLLAPLLLGAPKSPSVAALRITVADVGQGLAVLVQTRRHTLLYDTGPGYAGGGSAAASRLLPLLRGQRVQGLQRLVVSHADSDHAGGLDAISEAFPRLVLLAPQRLANNAARACVAGQSWQWDGVRFEVLHPDARQRRLRASDNDLSCVLLITAGNTRVLLPGDVSRRAEAAMLRQFSAGRVDLLLAPHHGSRTSSGPALVAATRPRYVVFATGYRNRWDFPLPEVTQRWSAAGACLLNTAEHGSLVFTLQPGRGLRLETASRRDQRRLWTAGKTPGRCSERSLTVE